MLTTKNISGFLIVDKPPHLTSHDVVNHIRRLLSATKSPDLSRRQTRKELPKVGHTGTLDPFATGVLLVAIGAATRFIEFTHAWPKEYVATFSLGATSDTDDLTGKITFKDNPNRPLTKSHITAALPQLIGTIQQLPPAFSAKKVMGDRAYRLARQGLHPALKPQTVTISEILIIDFSYPLLTLKITCSTGTYIRSLARDLGSVLHTGAYVSQLRRTRIGAHKISAAVKLKNLTLIELKKQLKPPQLLISHLPKIILSQSNVAQFTQGQTIGEQGTTLAPPPPTTTQSTGTSPTPITSPQTSQKRQLVAVFNPSSIFYGVAEYDFTAKLLYPTKVIHPATHP